MELLLRLNLTWSFDIFARNTGWSAANFVTREGGNIQGGNKEKVAFVAGKNFWNAPLYNG